MNIIDLELDNAFMECFTTSGGPSVECDCGREHVCITSDYFDPEDESDVAMVATYQERAKTDDRLVLNYEYDSISQIEVGGRSFAEDCECGGWKQYMNFILSHRQEIKNFLIKVSDKAQIALEHEKSFNILKETKF